MGLFDRKMKDPVAGTARVVDNDGLHNRPGQVMACPLDLVVEAEGVPAYQVHIKVHPKFGKWPEIDQILPVIIDRSDLTRVEIVWDQIPSLSDRLTKDRAIRLNVAEHSTTGGSAPLGTPADAARDFMRQAIADPAAFIETMRSQTRAPSSPDGVPGTPVATTPADPVDQLSKLADLRDRGVLTDSEFESQKRRILGT
jgi:hypothetical protein